MHTKIWWSYVHIRYLIHVQKWTYLALGWPYGWALNFNVNISILFIKYMHIIFLILIPTFIYNVELMQNFKTGKFIFECTVWIRC